MATQADLMGLGMPGALADRLGNSVASVTAAGTSSTGATLLKGSHTYVVSAASSQTGVILSSTQSIGDVVYITVTSSTSAVVYPPANATFNTSASTSLTLAQYKSAVIVRLSATSYMALAGA